MIDSLGLSSPRVSASLADHAERSCQRLTRTDCASGEMLWELTTGSLDGSYDTRVSVRIEREEVPVFDDSLAEDDPLIGVAVGSTVAARIRIEGSVHKAILGHNVFGGPLEVLPAARWFVGEIARRLGVQLPPADEWTIRRIDWAEAYLLPCKEAISEWFQGLSQARFPRRTVVKYGDQSVNAPGATMTTKQYHKGPEFMKHDYARLRDAGMDVGELVRLQELADRILRCEVEIRGRKLARDFGGAATCGVVTREYLEGVHDVEIRRLLKEADGAMEIVRNHLEVSRRLQGTYNAELSSRLFGTWMQLAALGEQTVRGTMKKATWYWQRKKLIDAGVSWNAADVCIVPTLSLLPFGFSPMRGNPLRMTEEAAEVRKALAGLAA